MSTPTNQTQPHADDTVLYENQFVALREHRGYSYLHMVRSNGRLVVLLPFRRTAGEDWQFLARIEVCPAHSDAPGRYSITGGVTPDETPEAAALRELEEEAGFSVTEDALIALGTARPSKQSDTLAFLYAVDVAALQQGEARGDGSFWEQDASTEWVSTSEALDVVDPLFMLTIARLKEKEKAS